MKNLMPWIETCTVVGIGLIYTSYRMAELAYSTDPMHVWFGIVSFFTGVFGLGFVGAVLARVLLGLYPNQEDEQG